MKITLENFENNFERFFDTNFNWEIANNGLLISLESDTITQGEAEIEEINQTLKSKGLRAELKTYHDGNWEEFRPKDIHVEDYDWAYTFENYEEDLNANLVSIDEDYIDFKTAFDDNKIKGAHIQFYTNNDPYNIDKVIELYTGSNYSCRWGAVGIDNNLSDAYTNDRPVAFVCEITED